MKKIEELKGIMEGEKWQERLKEIYVDDHVLEYQKDRYQKALDAFSKHFGEKKVAVYSAPGRSEIIGNHTDHQRGRVIAAAINNDAIAAIGENSEDCIRVISKGYDLIEIDLKELEYKKEEEGTTLALIKGTVSALKERGYDSRGFDAYITSDVLIGAGLSSSAAFEVLIGTIISGLFHDGAVSPVVIAQAAQQAENHFFGKPCGLMDQTASSVGGLIHIDFENSESPLVEKVDVDFDVYGYSLCIVDTKGSHADLTADYAEIPGEMKAVAHYFGKEVLKEVDQEKFYLEIPKLQKELGDRAVLRTIHFMEENKRVEKTIEALKNNKFDEFKKQIRLSGDSSFKYLQNVYSNHDVAHQGVSLGLAVSEIALDGEGVCRVHGGGFAGTIQAFVPDAMVEKYRKTLDGVFGEGACNVLKIRPYGGIRVI